MPGLEQTQPLRTVWIQSAWEGLRHDMDKRALARGNSSPDVNVGASLPHKVS